MYADVEERVRSYDDCQRRVRNCYEKPLRPTWSTIVWQRIGVDVVFIPWALGGGYIVFPHDDFSDWVEA